MATITKSERMNERVSFLAPVQSEVNGEWGSGGGGDSSESYELEFTCWADVKTQRYRDRLATVGTTYENTLSVVIRRLQKGTYDMTYHVEHRGVEYEIIEIVPDFNHREFVTITVKEV